MDYTNAQLAHYITKSCNSVREPLIEATAALNKVHAILAEDSMFESFIGNDEITISGDSSDNVLNMVAIITQPDIGDKYELMVAVEYSNAEKLYLKLKDPVQSVTILEWLLFHFGNDMLWSVETFE